LNLVKKAINELVYDRRISKDINMDKYNLIDFKSSIILTEK